MGSREHAVRKSKFTGEQIAFALKHAEPGISGEEVCRRMGISDAEPRRLRQPGCRWCKATHVPVATTGKLRVLRAAETCGVVRQFQE